MAFPEGALSEEGIVRSDLRAERTKIPLRKSFNRAVGRLLCYEVGYYIPFLSIAFLNMFYLTEFIVNSNGSN